jgi:hypothetical protein
MLRRNRRRERKRTAQRINDQRQAVLTACWICMAIGMAGIVWAIFDLQSQAAPVIAYGSLVLSALLLVFAHALWVREHRILDLDAAR